MRPASLSFDYPVRRPQRWVFAGMRSICLLCLAMLAPFALSAQAIKDSAAPSSNDPRDSIAYLYLEPHRIHGVKRLPFDRVMVLDQRAHGLRNFPVPGGRDIRYSEDIRSDVESYLVSSLRFQSGDHRTLVFSIDKLHCILYDQQGIAMPYLQLAVRAFIKQNDSACALIMDSAFLTIYRPADLEMTIRKTIDQAIIAVAATTAPDSITHGLPVDYHLTAGRIIPERPKTASIDSNDAGLTKFTGKPVDTSLIEYTSREAGGYFPDLTGLRTRAIYSRPIRMRLMPDSSYQALTTMSTSQADLEAIGNAYALSDENGTVYIRLCGNNFLPLTPWDSTYTCHIPETIPSEYLTGLVTHSSGPPISLTGEPGGGANVFIPDVSDMDLKGALLVTGVSLAIDGLFIMARSHAMKKTAARYGYLQPLTPPVRDLVYSHDLVLDMNTGEFICIGLKEKKATNL